MGAKTMKGKAPKNLTGYAEFERPVSPGFVPLPDPDTYAPQAGFDNGFPAASDGNSQWLVHCYGMIGVGRDMAPDSGTGAELYAVTGQAPRHLDRNITLAGRVVAGMDISPACRAGPGAGLLRDGRGAHQDSIDAPCVRPAPQGAAKAGNPQDLLGHLHQLCRGAPQSGRLVRAAGGPYRCLQHSRAGPGGRALTPPPGLPTALANRPGLLLNNCQNPVRGKGGNGDAALVYFGNEAMMNLRHIEVFHAVYLNGSVIARLRP